jgi:hypothetical protein
MNNNPLSGVNQPSSFNIANLKQLLQTLHKNKKQNQKLKE